MYFFVFELFSYNQSWADTDTKNFEIVDTDNDTDKNFNYGCYRAKVSREEVDDCESGRFRKWTVPKVKGPSKVDGLALKCLQSLGLLTESGRSSESRRSF